MPFKNPLGGIPGGHPFGMGESQEVAINNLTAAVQVNLSLVMRGMLLLTFVVLLAACTSDGGSSHALSGNYKKGVAEVTEGSGFDVYYSPPRQPYQTVGFVSLTGGGDLLPELRRVAVVRGANAAVITSQQTEHAGVNTSTITIGLGTPFFALPSYSNSQTRDVYVQKMSATLVKLR